MEVDKTANMMDVLRCLDKATIILHYDGIYFVADAETIFYFGAIESSRVPSKLGKFLKQNRHLAAGKKYYTKDNSPFYRRSKHIEGDYYTRTTECQ